MKIVDRYIGHNLITSTLTVLLVLLAIFTFFAFIEELEDIGRGSYTLGKAALVVGLSLPGLAYELFPIAALLGVLLGLGAMSERNEIAVVRCAGVSRTRVIWAVMKTGFVFVVVAVFIGEMIFPFTERKAQDMRALAIADKVATTGEHGFWARDRESYINIREILPGEEFRDINILEFDDDNRLRISTRAESAHYIDGRWELRQIRQTEFDGDQMQARHIARASWDSMLDPDLIEMVAINPDTLSLLALSRYVEFARLNGQNAQRWEHALWIKLGYPLSAGVMVFLAIPLVLRAASRSVTTGRRILIGTLIGLGFHVLNQASAHVGVVFGLAPWASALGPTALLFVLGVAMNLRLR
jgi:lipopolysaccharide export system permease protein